MIYNIITLEIKMKKINLPNNDEIEVENGLVIIGSNGSGKTRLGSWIDISSAQKNIVHRISAQKSLNFPDNIRSMSVASSQAALLCGHEEASLEQLSNFKTARKWNSKPETSLLNDYERLLVYLFSEHNEVSNIYLYESRKSEDKIKPPESKLLKIQRIWEEILPHRKLEYGSGDINTYHVNNISTPYKASLMSDGERVIFYLIGQAMSVPENGIFIIDEPELHLHKSIQYSLWNKIEKARPDCTFVYLTHDVDFAVSRVGFEKIWLTDFDGANWVWKKLENEVELPEELILELYGCRKKILLVEGCAGKNDVKFYQNIFSDLLVKPCGSCENVIAYTKSLRSNQSFHNLEVFGLIDKDRRTEETIISLEKQGIFTLKVAEVENLFATPEVLSFIAELLGFDHDEKLTKVKDFVMKQLQKEKDIQVTVRTTQTIKDILTKIDLSGKNQTTLIENYNSVINSINPENIFQDINKIFMNIIANNDYEKLLVYYNRKTIASMIGGVYGLKENELPEFITRQSKNEAHATKLLDAIKNYLPDKFCAL